MNPAAVKPYDDPTDFAKAALWYCQKGYSVIPARQDKKPFIAWAEFQKRAADENQIREWWGKWPNANPAIVCGAVSGVMVVDADSDAGIAAVNEFLPADPILPTVKTPRGGRHFYFKFRHGLENRVRALRDCDIRTEGGYVLAPPGRNGKAQYTWLPGRGLRETAPAAMPGMLFDILQGQGVPNVSQSEHKPDNISFQEGTRDNDLFRLANHLVKSGMPINTIGKYIEFFALNCTPPFPQKEIAVKIDSALKRSNDRYLAAPFKLTHIGELETKPPIWLIRDLIEADTLCLIFGDPGCGKSFEGVDIACCIATGEDFHGRIVKKSGAVVYIAGEGQNGIGRRFMAWGIRHNIDLSSAPLFVSNMPARLCDEDQAAHVIEAVDAVAAEHGPPAAIIIDTVARNFGPGNENDTRDMNLFVSACDRLRAQHQATLLLIHHTGHTDKTRARGAMALKGALDAEYRLDKDEEGVCRFEATKMKDAEFPEPMAFLIRSVELPFNDEDGQPVTSAILDSTEYAPRVVNNKAGRGKWQIVALKVLADLKADRQGRLAMKGLDSGTARVSVTDWRNACAERGMKRQAFSKVKKSLSEQQLIIIMDDFVS